ncbi:MAG TPA: DUF2092 domain-containing protein [Novosphingobium sp.]|nr:DUF2092 domain-containing protein [Novosphingobium sp.]
MVPATPATPAAPAGTTTPAPTGPIDPVAIEALTGMGKYLNSLKSFELRTKAVAETGVGDLDLQVHLGYEGLYKVQRPTAFYVELKSDRAVREYFYDGKSFTVNVPRQNFYSTVSAPSTIREMVEKAYIEYGIDLPLADLFYWAEQPSTDGVTTAVRIGFAKVNGQEADQFAFQGPDLDWQLWIARGKAPLPLKIVITDRSDSMHPSYSAELTWNTAPTLKAADFKFTPGAKASSIKMSAIPEEK